MAVETTTTSASFAGTGVSSTYAPGFYVNSSDQVALTVDGVLQTLGDDYVVNNVGASTGCDIVGTFTLGSAIYVERVTPITQLVDTQNHETILEDVLDAEFDKLTMIAQELSGKADRAILFPKGESGYDLPAVATRPNGILGFDAAGVPVIAASPAASVAAAQAAQAAAEAAKTSAEAARDATLTAYDSFDDRYLGAKAANPTLDNDGSALIGGTLYFNTVAQEMRMWTGAAWVAAYVSGTGFVAKTGDTMTGKLTMAASAGSGAGLNLPHGTAPAVPVNGDIWLTAAGGVFARINGVTINFAPLTNPVFTGNPAAPTPAAKGNDTSLATTAFVQGELMPSVQSAASAAAITPDGNPAGDDMLVLTALAANLTVNAPSGAPVQGKPLVLRIKDNGAPRTLTWNAIYRAVGTTLPAATVSNKTLYVGFLYNSTDTKWDCVMVRQEA